MPDHGRRTEPEPPATLAYSPAHVHIVTSLTELRIKPVNGRQPILPEGHVTSVDVFCLVVCYAHLSRSDRRHSDATRGRSIIQKRDVRAPHARVICFEECGGQVG